jgi:hypothetical protein
MKSLKGLVSLAAATALLTSCALIPPIPLGPDALGYSSLPVEVAAGTWSDVMTFPDIDPPSFPISPSAFISVQGFAESAVVSGTTRSAVTISGDSELRVTISDGSGSPAPVTTQVPFGPLTLRRSDECGGSELTCSYQFEDPAAASEALTIEIRGEPFKRLLRIVTEGDQTNTMHIELHLVTDSDPVTFKFTVEVKQNYIKL